MRTCTNINILPRAHTHMRMLTHIYIFVCLFIKQWAENNSDKYNNKILLNNNNNNNKHNNNNVSSKSKHTRWSKGKRGRQSAIGWSGVWPQIHVSCQRLQPLVVAHATYSCSHTSMQHTYIVACTIVTNSFANRHFHFNFAINILLRSNVFWVHSKTNVPALTHTRTHMGIEAVSLQWLICR